MTKEVKLTYTIKDGVIDTRVERSDNVSDLELIGILEQVKINLHHQLFNIPTPKK